MSEIIEHLFLGSVRYSRDEAFLKTSEITHILVAGKSLQQYFPETLKYLQFFITDSPSTLIIAFFPEAIQFIEEGMKKGKNVLVHCLGGRSRSVTIVASYLMFKLNISSQEAIEFIQKKHTAAYPNTGFLKQLKEFEICLDKYFERSVIDGIKKMEFEEKKTDWDERKTQDEEEEKMAERNVIKPKENPSNELVFSDLQSIVKRQIDKNFKK